MKGDTKLMTYTGRRWSDQKKKMVYSWIQEEQERWWEKHLAPMASIGQIWEFKVANEEGAFFVSGDNRPQYHSLEADEEVISGWRAAEMAALVIEANYRRSKKNQPLPNVEVAIQHLNKAYWSLRTGVEKTAFMMYVEEEMTRYHP